MRGVRARIFSIICLSLGFTILISANCFPWGGAIHRYIAHEAAVVMPEYIRNILMDTKETFCYYRLLGGIMEPDRTRVVDHQNISECAMMIERHAKQAEKMIRRGEDWEKIVFTLAQAAHYIQDLN